MNKIGENQCSDVLDSFYHDSTGLPETNVTRKKERSDSHIFYFRDWFNVMSARGLGEARCFRIYENIFSGGRGKFEEDGDISLCDFDRQGYCMLKDDKDKIEFLTKYCNRRQYSKEETEKFIAYYFPANKDSSEDELSR